MADKKPKPEKKKKPDKKAEKAPEADGDGPAEGAEGAEGADGEAAPKKKLAGKTLVLFIVLPALLILGAGGGAAFFLLKPKAEVHADAGDHGKAKKKKKDSHGKGKDKGGHGGAAKADGSSPVVSEGDGVYYVALPQMLINFSTDDGRPAFLKLRVTLEAPDEDVAYAVEPELPRIMDQFQGFLRELRMDDISGSAGTARLRLELLRRVNLAIAPAQMNAVLIEEMLVQ
jgi:flagellar FliL protein